MAVVFEHMNALTNALTVRDTEAMCATSMRTRTPGGGWGKGLRAPVTPACHGPNGRRVSATKSHARASARQSTARMINLRRFFHLFVKAVKAWVADYAPSMGAAISYYTVFSLAPLLVIVIALAGAFFGREAVQGLIVEQISGLIGREGAALVENLVSLSIATVLFAMIFKLMPSTPIDWRDVWIGAFVTAVLFEVGKLLIGLYLGKSGVTESFAARQAVAATERRADEDEHGIPGATRPGTGAPGGSGSGRR